MATTPPTQTSTPAPSPRLLDHPITHRLRPFLIGGTSGIIATTCIQPIDMIKVRLQLHGSGSKTGPRPSPLSIARDIISKGSVLDLYDGLFAGLLRQVVYGTSRLGFFFPFEDLLHHGTHYGFGQRAAASLTAGGLGAFIGNPVEVALIRMQSDGLNPRGARAGYTNVFNALARIATAEGVRWPQTLASWRFSPRPRPNLPNGRRLQQQQQQGSGAGGKGTEGKARYKGLVDCFVKVAREEGLMRFYRGFGTYVLRIAPHTIITLLVADKITSLVKGESG